jgi:predicted aldo/keto reductase-like oxidoreductase
MPAAEGPPSFFHTVLASPQGSYRRRICRLGLASRGDAGLKPEDVYFAIGERGVSFLNWCGAEDGLSAAVAGLGPRRQEVVLCVQMEARTAAEARREFDGMRRALGTDFIDVVTFYYVEQAEEWAEIIRPGGALAFCAAAQRAGQIGLVGVTSHQRPLLAEMARSELLDLLMFRYNAAHRGAETEVFPTTTALGLPVVAYTCLRWGALLRATPDDPPGFVVPGAPAWYRFALQHPAVTVALMAPADRAELEEDLTVLEATGPLSAEEFEVLAAHGRRVRQHAGRFP